MANISAPFRPFPSGAPVGCFAKGRVREIKTAFIPYGTNAALYRVRGATQLRLASGKNFVRDAMGASLTLFEHDRLVYALAL